MSERTRVIAILSLPHSGSHLLSHLLGAHPACLSIGELHNYRKLTDPSRQTSDNVVSNYADNALFAGLGQIDQDNWHQEILQRARAGHPVVTTLVDNSKRVGWCRSLAGNPALEVHPVHLVRDPRALFRYWMLKYETPKMVMRQRIRHARMAPAQAITLLTAPPRTVYLRKWLIRNQEITQLLRQTGSTANVVTYHDLVTQPEQTLRRLMPKLGLDYDPGQLRYGEATHYGTSKRDYQDATQTSAIDLDVRWQSYLQPDDLAAVESDSRLSHYLEEINLQLAPQGLTAPAGS